MIVVTHRPCLTMGVKRCEMGAPIFDLLIEKRVDLILHGHEHSYQRSKQLAHGPGCSAIVPDTFSPACIGDAGRAGVYPKGGGSVVVIDGMGGAQPYALSPLDPEAGYFAAAMTRETFGVVRVAATRARLDVAFVPTTAGGYRDAFAIAAR